MMDKKLITSSFLLLFLLLVFNVHAQEATVVDPRIIKLEAELAAIKAQLESLKAQQIAKPQK